MEKHSRDMFFHSFSGARCLPEVVPLSILSVILITCFSVLNLMFRGPVPEVAFFFSQPAAGLLTWLRGFLNCLFVFNVIM